MVISIILGLTTTHIFSANISQVVIITFCHGCNVADVNWLVGWLILKYHTTMQHLDRWLRIVGLTILQF